MLNYYIDNGLLPNVKHEPLIPQMTSNSTPSGTASSYLMGGAAYNVDTMNTSTNYAYYAFDGNEQTHVGYNAENKSGGYIEYDFVSNVQITRWAIKFGTYLTTNNIRCELQAWVDNNWVDLDSIVLTGMSMDLSPNPIAYSKSFPSTTTNKIRLLFGSNTGQTNCYINTCQVYGKTTI